MKAKNSILIVAVLVFLVTALIASGGDMAHWEIQLFDNIYHWPSGLQPMMLFITQAGSSWMIFGLSAFLILKRRVSLAAQVLAVGLSTYASVEVAKRIIDRPRPFELLPNVHARESFVTGMGFPSGHTAAITAVGLVLYYSLPKKHRHWVFVWVGLVGLSRVYLGVHAPLDIIGGLALGVTVAELFMWAKPKLRVWSKHLK